MFVEVIDVGGDETSAIEIHLELFIIKCIHVDQQLLQRFDVSDIAGQLPVIKRQPGLLAKQQSQIDLRQVLMILIFSIAGLAETLRITGYRCAVVSKIFPVCSAFALKPKKALSGFFGN